jgi:hypothetical protein
VNPVSRAATTLLGTIVVVSAGCHSNRNSTPLPLDDRARVYAAVLAELRHDSRAEWVVVDTLLPAYEIDSDVRDKIIAELPISRRAIDAFIEAQREPIDRFQSVVLPDAHWTTVSMPRLDSLRAAVRADIASGATPRGVRNDAFWQQWQRLFPGSAGYVILSPASIADDGATAVVHVRIACGSVCGETELRSLRRGANGNWRTINRLRLSES